MTQDRLKHQAARAALRAIEPLLERESVVGVGTGSTANHFINGLPELRSKFAGAVSSSRKTTELLAARGIRVLNLSDVEKVAVYVDGADEVAPDRVLIKGGGGALVREKIVAASAECFVCVVDAGKLVDALGAFPLPVEVLPTAQRLAIRRLRTLGGEPTARAGLVTDNGNHILDVRGLPMADPQTLARDLNDIPGVVDNGIFAGALRPQVVLVGAPEGPRAMVADDCPPSLRQAVAAGG